MKRCKICHVEAELDDQGRCGGCAASQKALEHGMTYGKYMAMLEAQGKSKIKARRIEIVMATCPWCGKPFPKSGKRVYCSDLCYKAQNYAAHRERLGLKAGSIEPQICPKCGKEFTPSRRGITYCSRECRLSR